MEFDILTLFPETVEPYVTRSILGNAQDAKHIAIRTWNIRDFADDKHRTVDDTPYGGGAGMVMKVEPIDKTLQEVQRKHPSSNQRVVVLSARGTPFTQKKAQEFAALDRLILICGRYEGIDQRVVDNLADEEVSIGPYVLAGGEIGALAILEATARLIPGVLGNPASLDEESHSDTHLTEYPQYTKPETYKGWSVPEVLRSGHHEAIEAWRKEQSKGVSDNE